MILLDGDGEVIPDRNEQIKNKRKRMAKIRREIKEYKELGRIKITEKDL